jgi:NarL family two-component system response regulator YdfI
MKPDVVLMDLRMPGMDGLTAIERLRVEQPGIAVVILTTFNEDDLMMRGLRAGAKGYLLKDTDRETLFNTIRAAARGETLLRPEIIARVLTQAGRMDAQAASATDLTEREQEVLNAVAQGERSKEIAVRLGISERTVKAHLASIYNRLGVDSRAAAIAVAAQRGWLDLRG